MPAPAAHTQQKLTPLVPPPPCYILLVVLVAPVEVVYRWWERGGVNSRKGCFGRKKNTKFFRKSEDFAGNRETWKMSGKLEVTKLKFWEFAPKIGADTSNLREEFYLHMVLLKQHLLELSPSLPPPPTPCCMAGSQLFS